MVAQICNLERRTARGGRDSVDHPAGSAHHDDLANSALGLAAISVDVASVGWSPEVWDAVNGTNDALPSNRAAEEIERARRVHPASYAREDLGHGGYRVQNYDEYIRAIFGGGL